MAMAGIGLLIAIILFVTVGGVFFSEADANYNDLAIKLSPPSREHLFGTDLVGYDILARSIYGGQISIVIGILAVLVSLVVGVLVGAVAGFYGGIVDGVLMRFTEAMLNIPQLFLLIVLAKFLGGKVPTVYILNRSFSGHHRRNRTDQLDVSSPYRTRQLSVTERTGVHHRRPLPRSTRCLAHL
jgi:peptide/nickel transport system permease protein